MNQLREIILHQLTTLRSTGKFKNYDHYDLLREYIDTPLKCSNGQDIEMVSIPSFGMDITSVANWLNNVMEQNPQSDISITVESSFDYDGYIAYDLVLNERRKETDKEYAERLSVLYDNHINEEVFPIKRSDDEKLNSYIEYLESKIV